MYYFLSDFLCINLSVDLLFVLYLFCFFLCCCLHLVECLRVLSIDVCVCACCEFRAIHFFNHSLTKILSMPINFRWIRWYFLCSLVVCSISVKMANISRFLIVSNCLEYWLVCVQVKNYDAFSFLNCIRSEGSLGLSDSFLFLFFSKSMFVCFFFFLDFWFFSLV